MNKEDVYVMELLKKLFKDDEKIVGLCALKKKEQKIYSFTPDLKSVKLVHNANYSKNLFIN